MAVLITTVSPVALLRAFTEALDRRRIVTWRYVARDGMRLFTHSAAQWDGRAWFRPAIFPDKLVFNIRPSRVNVSRVTYGVFHARLAESLLAHFDQDFDEVVATALAVQGDVTQVY